MKINEKYIGKPVTLVKRPSFKLDGVILSIVDTTIEFQTSQLTSLIEADEIIELRERVRTSKEELCPNCHKVWYRKSSVEACPYCYVEKKVL